MHSSTGSPVVLHHRPRRRARIALLYSRAILREFRWTLLILAAAVVVGTVLHEVSPQRPPLGDALYGAWMALVAQPLYSPPIPWYLKLVYCAYPVLGFVLLGEGVVRLALLLMSKRQGEKEWMQVMASTYRDHIVLCGLGHLGIRVLEQLVAAEQDVVVLERSASNPFLSQAKAMDVPVLVRDMKDDQALMDAGIKDATAVIIASNDEVTNLEVALDSRRMNPKIRVVMRLFDQRLAAKIAGALTIDAAFSSSSLAAPVVAAMSLRTKVISSMMIGDEPYVAAEVTVEEKSPLAGKKIAELEMGYVSRVLARTPRGGATQASPAGATIVEPGDTLIFHTSAKQLSTVAAAAQRAT